LARPCPASDIIASRAAILTPLLSLATYSETPFSRMAFPKKRLAASIFCFAVRRKSIVSPLVDGAVEIFPDAPELEIGLILAPAKANRPLVLAKHPFKKRQESDQPANAHHNHVNRETHPFRRSMHTVPCVSSKNHRLQVRMPKGR
jgi:hypothetical protein